MLYTFSQADYGFVELKQHLEHCQAQDALLLWQDGVLLALKYPDLLQQAKAPCYVLDMDLTARNLNEMFNKISSVKVISLTELVSLTEQFYPQLGL
ncbi:sulfurtransferase complex subunit TusB [[Haemophilus] felis]|uniref:Sulfurtransferase TusB n=1 Tax=[Haemophilus] felis TaxID=123822 RepID=A0A1T0B0A9_9PAST|nr:sulfurtransferase complex subunit TusB [[Haemophilus] felis]NBI41702.1 sulfurtransferase complex subunit TusB [[Haemophilus] felis]OOS03640.1 hypothetical protein B0188_06055 [[Haemophilus] felis]